MLSVSLTQKVSLFQIFDLKRNGSIGYTELQQGLSTSCSPEIDIIQTAAMVQELLNCMTFVVQESGLVNRVISLTVNCPSGFGSRSASNELCTIAKIRRKNPSAVGFCKEQLADEWAGYHAAVNRVGRAAIRQSDLDSLDGALYGLRYVTHTLVMALNEEVRATDELGAPRHSQELRTQLRAFKRDLTQAVMGTCTEVMDLHVRLHHLAHGSRGKITESEVLKKYVQNYLLRRRLKLISRVQKWAKEPTAAKKKGLHLGRKKSSAWDQLSPLVRFQARMRGALGRLRMRKLREQAVARGKTLEEEEKEELSKDVQIGYFDWPSVLIQYLRVGASSITSLKEAAMKVLLMLKMAREKEERQQEDSKVLGDEPASETVPFPQILLDDKILQQKLDTLRATLHNWNEMLMMLDQNTSGNLNPIELRCSLLAFSQMGIITEQLEFQPMDATYGAYRDRLYKFGELDKSKRGLIGWSEDIAVGRAPYRKHPYWEGRQDYMVRNRKAGSRLPDFPIYTSPGSVLLLGVEGMPIGLHPWALEVEFQFDESNPDAYRGAKKYSILISSYRNNAIVARLSGTMQRPGIQLLFIKNEAFLDSTQLVERCHQYERVGRRQVTREATLDKEHEDNSDTFPLGEGTFEITPFIPMEQLRWYRVEIHGDKMSAVDTPGSSEDNLYRLRVRVDPLHHETGEVLGEEVLEYRNGTDHPLQNGGDHSFGGLFRPLRTGPLPFGAT